MTQLVWSVSSLVSYIKRGIDHDENLMQLMVQGEVSNLVKHRSGHYYFTLKDNKSRMSCVMFSNYARLVHFNLENGSKVIAHCRVSVYEAGGSMQLYVNALQLDGIGDLYLQLEALKKKMMNEGYFDPSHKKALPEYPMDIALISAKEAAAASDVRTTIERRWPLASITFYPSLVQGNDASRMLIETIMKADQRHHDVILLVRGGGSLEDLWAFNNEELARCIYSTQTVIVTGVGHETDTTLVDYVSDARAATPTAAAELITPDIQDVKKLLTHHKGVLLNRMNELFNQAAHRLDKVKSHPYMKEPLCYIENSMISLDLKKSAFEYEISRLMNMQSDIREMRFRFAHAAELSIQKNMIKTQQCRQELFSKAEQFYQRGIDAQQKRIALLDAYSPLKVLQRGYSLTQLKNVCIKSVDEVEIDDDIAIVVSDGVIYSKVMKKEKKHG